MLLLSSKYFFHTHKKKMCLIQDLGKGKKRYFKNYNKWKIKKKIKRLQRNF